MDTAEQLSQYNNVLCLASPAIYKGDVTPEALLKAYLEAVEFARNTSLKNDQVNKL